MAIAHILEQATTDTKKGPPCAVCDALASLSDTDAAALRGLLANPNVRYQALSDALAADEDTPLDLPAGTLSRHARGRCSAKERLR